MSFTPPPVTHFDGGQNVTRGQVPDSQTDLAAYLRKIRSGSHIFAGSGSYSVAFSEDFEDANYALALAATEADVLPIWASKTKSGFSLTAAADGVVDWIALHD